LISWPTSTRPTARVDSMMRRLLLPLPLLALSLGCSGSHPAGAGAVPASSAAPAAGSASAAKAPPPKPAPASPSQGPLPTMSPPSLVDRADCGLGMTCKMDHLVPDDMLRGLSARGALVMWEETIAGDAEVIFPADSGIELVGVVIDGGVDLLPQEKDM